MNKSASLPPHILTIVQDKNTEFPFSSTLNELAEPGTYLCRQCGLALYRAHNKFISGCGWPSFDEEIKGNINYIPDKDGMRMEIVCQRCHAHLGHVFYGEYFTENNVRHCVNGLSIEFVNDNKILDSLEAIFAGGCFWGMEYFLQKLPGVLKTEVGYIGGHKPYPTYNEVCGGNTGHYEALRVVFNPNLITYETLMRYFFEIHDPGQINGQGPDIGLQYQSAIFYYDEEQKKTAEKLVTMLRDLNFKVMTKIIPVTTFWRAEESHQNYYDYHNKLPYCHQYQKKFK